LLARQRDAGTLDGRGAVGDVAGKAAVAPYRGNQDNIIHATAAVDGNIIHDGEIPRHLVAELVVAILEVVEAVPAILERCGGRHGAGGGVEGGDRRTSEAGDIGQDEAVPVVGFAARLASEHQPR